MIKLIKNVFKILLIQLLNTQSQIKKFVILNTQKMNRVFGDIVLLDYLKFTKPMHAKNLTKLLKILERILSTVKKRFLK